MRGSHFENFVTSNGSSEQHDLGHLKLNFGSLSTDGMQRMKFKVHRICFKYNFECVNFF